MKEPTTLGLTDAEIGAGATVYLVGQVVGALFFGFGTDRIGRKKLFYATLLIYLSGTALTAFWIYYYSVKLILAARLGGDQA